jgi:hypothetical protein
VTVFVVVVVVGFIGACSHGISSVVVKAVEEGVRGRRLKSCGFRRTELVAEKGG